MRSRANFIVRIVRNIDVVVLAALATGVWDISAFSSRLDFLFVILLIPFNASLFQYYGLYESHRVEGIGLVLRGLLSAQIACFAAVAVFLLASGWTRHLPSTALYFAAGFAVTLTQRFFLYATLGFLRGRGFDLRRTCVVGTRASADRLEERFSNNPAWGLKVCYWGEGSTPAPRFSRFPSGQFVQTGLEELLRNESVDEVVIFSKAGEVERSRPLMSLCKEHGVMSRLVIEPDGAAAHPADQRMEEFLGSVSYAVDMGNPGMAAFIAKRMMDLLLSSILMVVLLPVLLVVALLVKLSSRGPVLFRQKRMGLYGRRFTMYKFRTMVDGAEGILPSLAARNITDGPAFKSPDDWRVTPVGRWLRRYSLDELPQVFNVFKGDMSLVGPRPLPVAEALNVTGSHRRRFSMRPGLTCFWQVSGRSDITFGRWMAMDLEYVDGWSLWVDTKLLFLTIPAVISGRGAY